METEAKHATMRATSTCPESQFSIDLKSEPNGKEWRDAQYVRGKATVQRARCAHASKVILHIECSVRW